MTIREIKTFPSEVLRKKAEPISKFDKDLHKLVDDMVETMRVAPGVGLAAPQVGISERVAVVEFGHEDDEDIPRQLYVLVNPEIVKMSDETVRGIEGCLSVPGLVGSVDRAKVVTVRAQDQHGKKLKIRAVGWLARIFQHEIDHLDGVLYTDRAVEIWQPDEEMPDMV
ncbi:MAG TPA: peptide deformylase [Anaerolineaceae bacterium]|jgi:peptide deformylase|nr:peptide deformylase [Anaerolineaceae bacterium]